MAYPIQINGATNPMRYNSPGAAGYGAASAGQYPASQAQASYGPAAQAGYPADSYQPQAQPGYQGGQISAEQAAYLQQLQRQQQKETERNPVKRLWNKLPTWGKIVAGLLGTAAAVYVGKGAINNSYRVERFFRPQNRAETLGNRDLTKLVCDRQDAEKDFKAANKRYEQAQKTHNKYQDEHEQAHADLNNYTIWERVWSITPWGNKEIKKQRELRNSHKTKAEQARIAFQEAANEVQEFGILYADTRSQEAEFRRAVLEDTQNHVSDRLANVKEGSNREAGFTMTADIIEEARSETHHLENEANAILSEFRKGNLTNASRLSEERTVPTKNQTHKLAKPNFLQRIASSFNGNQQPGNPYAYPALTLAA